MSEVLPPVEQVEFLRALYLAPPETLREHLRQVDDPIHTILLVGHNPGCQQLLAELCGVEHPMKTANAALLSTSAASWWSAAAPGQSWRLDQLIQAQRVDPD
jgi:phosphohistidine phosphatase